MIEPLRVRLEVIWDGLRAEHGDLGVPRAAFVAHVQDTIAARVGDADPLDVLERLVLGDIYLVLGCLGGSDRAVRVFLRRFGAYLQRLSQRHAPSVALGEDVEAQLLATLFTPRRADDPRSARLASYRGLGTLQGWLRVTARRMVIDMVRRLKPEDGADRLDRIASDAPRIDLRLERLDAVARLRPVFLAAVGELSPEERALLRSYYRDGRVLREIGDELGIDTSSVFRRLGVVRQRIWRRFRAGCRDQLGLDEGDLRGLIGPLAAQLDLDQLLATAVVLLWT